MKPTDTMSHPGCNLSIEKARLNMASITVCCFARIVTV